jgi:hypothetical protein
MNKSSDAPHGASHSWRSVPVYCAGDVKTLQVCRAPWNTLNCRQPLNHRIVVGFSALPHFAINYYMGRFRAAIPAPNWYIDVYDLQGRFKPARNAHRYWRVQRR